MTNKEILQADLLDILFEHRNKAYGAYALRKTYGQRLKWALGISLGFSLAFVLFNFSGSNNSDRPPGDLKWVKLSSVNLSPEKPRTPELPKPKTRPQQAQTAYTNHIEIVDDSHRTEMPDQAQIDTSLISGRNVTGLRSDDPGGNTTTATESGTGNTNIKPGQTFSGTSSDAQFPGGSEAFTKFLTRYLVTPPDLEPGEKKTVLVRFIVDTDGTISRTEVIQSDREQYTHEVQRVLVKMPRWIPATQNGLKVVTWFSQRVTFIGLER